MKNKFLALLLAVIIMFAYAPIGTKAETIDLFPVLNGDHMAFVAADGSLWTWGSNEYGMLGNGECSYWDENDDDKYVSKDSLTPIRVGTDNNWVHAAIAQSHTIALKKDGTLWAWGSNGSGQFGNGTTTDSYVPIQIGTETNWACVSTYLGHTVATKKDGTLWTWGANNFGDIGGATPTKSLVPVKFGTDNNWASVSTNRHTVALKTDGTLWAWGWNYGGQLGDGTTTDKNEPVQIGTDKNWVSAVAGVHHTFAIKADGSLWAWGDGTSGQIGKDKDWKSVTANGERNNWNSAVAIKKDGSLWSLINIEVDGQNWIFHYEPERIGSDNTWVGAIVASWGYHCAAYKTDGSLWMWDDMIDWDYENEKYFENDRILQFIWQNDPLSSAGLWARESITSAIQKGFIPADLQGSYASVITRAEFCRTAVKWLEYATGKSIYDILNEQGKMIEPGAFTDTQDHDILAAYALDITNGTGPNKFTPNGQFCREEAATMIMRTCRVIGADVSNAPTADFIDLNTVSDWALAGVNFVRANGIMQGTGNGKFTPKAMYSREQAIVTLNNIKPDTLPGR